jgi:hypothetical protein
LYVRVQKDVVDAWLCNFETGVVLMKVERVEAVAVSLGPSSDVSAQGNLFELAWEPIVVPEAKEALFASPLVIGASLAAAARVTAVLKDAKTHIITSESSIPKRVFDGERDWTGKADFEQAHTFVPHAVCKAVNCSQ